eukprot:4430410-Heterocapsa_arctica.AAC.1
MIKVERGRWPTWKEALRESESTAALDSQGQRPATLVLTSTQGSKKKRWRRLENCRKVKVSHPI